jgi:hypothetical protein
MGVVRRSAGVLVLLFGTVLLLWVGYNLFIETLPEARGRNPVPAMLLIAGCYYLGINWVRGRDPKPPQQWFDRWRG